jgi:hypothetical protein
MVSVAICCAREELDRRIPQSCWRACLIIRLTRKLATKLGANPVPSLPSTENSLFDWTAHLFMAGHRQHIIVVNSATLYSCVIPGGRCRSASTFMNFFNDSLAVVLERDGLGPLPDYILDCLQEDPVFCRASDRRVQGSINDFVLGAEVYIIEAGLPLPEVSYRLNQTPMKQIKYSFPSDEMRNLI